MGSGAKKVGKKGMGQYAPTKKERDAMNWCLDHDIKMWPRASTKGPNPEAWYIEIQMGSGKINKSPEAYGKVEIWKQLFTYYMYYYEKSDKKRD